MIDHLTPRVADLEKGKAFFLAALKPLGYVAVMDFPGMAGLGEGGKPDFWLRQAEPFHGPMHLAFAAGSRHHLEAVIHTPE